VKKALPMLIGLALSSPTLAQDFMQEWHDNAVKSMDAFRAAHQAEIEARGWQFVSGTVSSEGIPMADLFFKDVKVQDGAIRSASVLTAAYVPVQPSGLPGYQSTNAVVWFDCKGARFEQRGIKRYASADGSGEPTSSEAEKPASAPMQPKDAEPESTEKTLLTAVCSAKP